MDTKIKFQQLTQTWYETIAKDYHKDRDCHFRVYRLHAEYSYGQEPEHKNSWVFEHNGYVIGDVIESFASEQEMYTWACEWLESHIQQEISTQAEEDL